MAEKTKKSSEPELIEDAELDETSGGTQASGLRSGTNQQQAAWPSKIEIDSLKAGDTGG